MHKAVGDLIDFYNVQFYNQGNSEYNTYKELFIDASGFFSNTSVKQIMNRGIPPHKIIVGKPATSGDAMNTGYVNSTDLGAWCEKAATDLNWFGGGMFWQFKNDLSGNIIKAASNSLITKAKLAGIFVNNTIIPP